MSLNTAHHQDGVLLFNGERIIIFHKGVEATVELSQQCSLFDGTSYAFSNGNVYLTTHRVIVLNKNKRQTVLRSISIPFAFIKDIAVKQPIFSANYVQVKVRPQPEGGFDGDMTIKLSFYRGGAIEFRKAFSMAVDLSRDGMSSLFEMENAIIITGIHSASNNPQYIYAVPEGQYDWAPHYVFPDQPERNDVYLADNPPPYPGLANPPTYDEAVRQIKVEDNKATTPPSYSQKDDSKKNK